LFPFILTWYVVLSELCPFIQRKSTHVIEFHGGEGSHGSLSRSAMSNVIMTLQNSINCRK
jgi:hypothetical protein